MTKAWDDIREQASHLYAEGKSLEQVRAILLRERKFQASYASTSPHSLQR